MSLIKKTRKQLSLSTTQLGHRLGIQQSTVVRLEQSEERGAVTLNSLRKAAQAMGYKLKYSFVPSSDNSSRDPSTSKSTHTRRQGLLSDQLYLEEIELAAQLTAAQRIRRAFELTDFARKMRRCSK